MAFTYPQFDEPTWSATFDSYDQRNDDVYYVITLKESGKRIMGQVSIAWAGDDWNTPEFTQRLRDDLARIAASGQSNTSHTGGVVPSL
jgi:hypothetical protein